jgi:hypothetical protein
VRASKRAGVEVGMRAYSMDLRERIVAAMVAGRAARRAMAPLHRNVAGVKEAQ